jgi:death-on-curing family protein
MTAKIGYYLQPDDIRYIHSYILRATKGVEGEMHNGLDTLCQNAQLYLEEQTLEGLAAFYLARLAKGHSFTDGNKRTAYFATRYFLMRNKADFNGRDIKEAADEMDAIASASNGDAYNLARQLVEKYIVKDQILIETMEQFERIVLKSIGVATLLSER